MGEKYSEYIKQWERHNWKIRYRRKREICKERLSMKLAKDKQEKEIEARIDAKT